MNRVFVFCGLLLMWIAEANSGSNLQYKNGVQLDQSEIERQNRITKQIFANYLERHLFPFRRTNQRIPTIDDILPRTVDHQASITSHSRANRRQTPNANASDYDENEDDNQDIGELADIREGDDESLQSVESEQFDQYYRDLFDRDPSENEVDNGENDICIFIENRR